MPLRTFRTQDERRVVSEGTQSLNIDPGSIVTCAGLLCRLRLLSRALPASRHCHDTAETISVLCSWTDGEPCSMAVLDDCVIVEHVSSSVYGLLRLWVLWRLLLADTTFGSPTGRDRDGLWLRR